MARVRVVENAGSADEVVTAVYLRVTAEESVKVDLSLPNQRRRALEICAERGWSPVKVYQEPKHVGGDEPPSKRPALAELLSDIESGRAKRVLVRHDDRLWRSTEVQDTILKALRENSIDLWTFAGQRELRSAGGRFAIKVLGAAAELEKGLTSERIREMKRGKAHAGRLGGGPPSFGYTSQSRAKLELLRQGVPEDEAHRLASEKYPVAKTWCIDEKEAEVVRLIFKLYIDDRLGTRRISQELNRRGHRRRSGLVWCPVKVGRIVNNPAVAGLTSYDEDAYAKGLPSRAARYQQKLFPGQHPAIISVERWREAQHLKSEENAKHVRTRGASKSRVYPLTGVLRCGVCGGTMSGRSSGTKRGPYYVCSRRKHYGPTDGCPGPSMPMRLADEAIWDYLGGLFRTPESLQAVMDRVNRDLAERAPEFEARLREVRLAMADLEAKLRKWMEKYEAATDDAVAEIVWQRIRELKNQEMELRREADGLEERLSARTKRQLSLDETAAYLERLRVEPTGEAVRKRSFIEKLHRFHDLDIRVLDARRMAVFMRLDQPNPRPAPEEATEAIGCRVGIIGKAATTSGPTPMYPGKPYPEDIGPHGDASRPAPKLMGIIGLRAPRAETGSQWTYRLQHTAPLCACGCGEQIRLRSHHRTHGIPKYIQGHHSTPLRRAYERFRKEGYMFLDEVCRELGISATAYWRLEVSGKIPKVQRRKGIGGTMVRVFKRADLMRLRMFLESRRPSPA